MDSGSNNTKAGTGRQQGTAGARSAKQCAIDEREGQKAKRRLERELSCTDVLGVYRGSVRPSFTESISGRNPSTKSRLKLGSRAVQDFTMPVVRVRQRRSANGLRSFHYRIEPIPKTVIERRLPSGTKIYPGAAEKGARYNAGDRDGYLIGDRTHKDEHGKAFFISNIDTDLEKCFEFFAHTEQFERNPSPDVAIINFAANHKVWQRVVDSGKCDPAVIAAYRKNPRGIARVELTRGAGALKEILKEHGFVPADTAFSQEERANRDGIEWCLGRGGRASWRLVGALPAEFSDLGREEALRQICALFEAKGCMTLGLIHEPAATNHVRNWHFHLAIYDRPCRRLDGTTADLVNVSARFKDEIELEIAQGDFVQHIGKWDFTAVRDYKSPSGNKLKHRPFGANKSTAMRSYSIPKESRKEIERIINSISREDGGGDLYDARTYREMEIDKDPDEPLGPDASALQAKGVPTQVGMRNEQRHVKADRRAIERAYQSRMADLQELATYFDGLTLRLRFMDARAAEREWAARAIANARMAAETQRNADHLELELRRELSTAYHVIRTSNRVIRAGEDTRGDYATRMEDAKMHWRSWQQLHQDEIASLKKMRAAAAVAADYNQLRQAVLLAARPTTDVEVAAWHKSLNPDQPIIMGKQLRTLLAQAQSEAIRSAVLATIHEDPPKSDASSAKPDDHVNLPRPEQFGPLVRPTLRLPQLAGLKADLRPTPTGQQLPEEASGVPMFQATAQSLETRPPILLGKRLSSLLELSLLQESQLVAHEEIGGDGTIGVQPAIDLSERCGVEKLNAIIPVHGGPPDSAAAKDGVVLPAVGSQRPSPRAGDDAGREKTEAADVASPIISRGRRNIMQRKSPDARPAATAALDTIKSNSPPEHGPMIVLPQSATAARALDVLIAPPAVALPSSPNAVSLAALSSSTPSIDIERAAHIVDTSETAPAEMPLLPLADIGSNQPISSGRTDEPKEGEICDWEAQPRNVDGKPVTRKHDDPADATGISSAANRFIPAPSHNALDAQSAPTSPGEVGPDEGLRMDVVKENYPASRPLSGEVADRRAVPAEMHLRQSAMPAQSIGNADVSQTAATNTSKVNAVSVVDHMLAAFVVRLEERNVRLADVDGKIVAAPGQALKRGDEPFIKASQDACRALKERQDGVAIASGKALWLNAEAVAAGRSTDIDPLLLLAKKWVDDPFIAFGLKHVDRQKAIRAAKREAAIANGKSTAPIIQRGIPPAQGIGLN